jgi:hypothetical protein
LENTNLVSTKPIYIGAGSNEITLHAGGKGINVSDLYSLLQCGLKGKKIIWGEITSWTNEMHTIKTGLTHIYSVSLTHYAYGNNWGDEPSLTVRSISNGDVTVFVDNAKWHAFYIIIGD